MIPQGQIERHRKAGVGLAQMYGMSLRPYGVALPICTYRNGQGNHEVDKKVQAAAADTSQYGRCLITLEHVDAGVPEVYSHGRQSVVKVLQLRVILCMLVSRLCRVQTA